ncbi:hypothetical protein SLEP1_g34341 [Rubroshorea leprosula]|uniref:Uncharacterized protein n=1 Tax=Rubroshorea leprosula TaxID=152421 RepID=A0AAV5KJJ6_9ROSI|nr:hypothetical protein SLEP1_g34341 [Rubroshorea leprosula]
MASRPFDGDCYIGYDPRLPSERFDSFFNFDAGSVKDSVCDSLPVFSSQSYIALEMTCSNLSCFLRPCRRHQLVAVVVDSRNSQLRRTETVSTAMFW